MRTARVWSVVFLGALAALWLGAAGCTLFHDDVLGGEPVLTTSFADVAGGAELPDDFGRGEHFEPLASLPREEGGGYVLRPGFFTLEAQSFCLHAGTRGPSRGEGYLWAPLKGPGAALIQALLRSAGHHPHIAQHDVQMLVWALESRSPIHQLSPELQHAAAELLSPEQLRQVNGSVLEDLAPQVRAQALARLPPDVRRALELQSQIHSLFISGRGTYEQVRQLAVLPALDRVEGAVRLGRWSKHPGGYYVRYLPSGYTRTRIDVYVPRPGPAARTERDGAPHILQASLQPPTPGDDPGELLLDLVEDVAMPADTGSQRLGFSGGGGESGGGGSSDSYGDDPQPLGKKPIPCDKLPSSYEFTSLDDAVREVEERLGLPEGSAYAGESVDANTGPCAKGTGYKVGKHIATDLATVMADQAHTVDLEASDLERSAASAPSQQCSKTRPPPAIAMATSHLKSTSSTLRSRSSCTSRCPARRKRMSGSTGTPTSLS